MRSLITAVFFLLTFAGGAFAQAEDLGRAKASGYVGETPSGYLALVTPSAPGDVQALIAEINAKRRVEYQSIAAKNGTDIRAVEVLAGKKAIEKTPSGQYVQLPSGSWTKK